MMSKHEISITNKAIEAGSSVITNCSNKKQYENTFIIDRFLGTEGCILKPRLGVEMNRCDACLMKKKNNCLTAVTKYSCFIDLKELVQNDIVKLWKYNRKIKKERVLAIKEHQIESLIDDKHIVLTPNNLTFCTIKNVIYILDGQHRFTAVKQLLEDEKYNSLINSIFVYAEIFINCDEDFAKKQFKFINLAQPVPIHVVLCNDKMNSTLQYTIDELNKRYPGMLSEKNVYRPKLTIDSFKKHLTKFLIDNPNYIVKPHTLLRKIVEYNNVLWKEIHQPEYVKLLQKFDHSITPKIIIKTINNDFTIGINPSYFFSNMLD